MIKRDKNEFKGKYICEHDKLVSNVHGLSLNIERILIMLFHELRIDIEVHKYSKKELRELFSVIKENGYKLYGDIMQIKEGHRNEGREFEELRELRCYHYLGGEDHENS